MELVYAKIFVGERRVAVWSSSRGEIFYCTGGISELTKSGITANDPSARLMAHILDGDAAISDGALEPLMEWGRRAGFGIVRIERGDPELSPEEAFNYMLVPFT